MPLALAAPRIGCDRSPSLARRDCRLGSRPDSPDAGSRLDSRIEASPSERKQWLFETEHLKAQGGLRHCHSLRRDRLPGLRAECPSARNRRPLGAASGDLGNLPSSAPRDGDSDLTSCVGSGGIVPPDPLGFWPARPSPYRRGSCRDGCFDQAPSSHSLFRCRSSLRTTVSHSALCLVMRAPRVRARRRPTWSRASLDQCLFYRTSVTGDIL